MIQNKFVQFVKFVASLFAVNSLPEAPPDTDRISFDCSSDSGEAPDGGQPGRTGSASEECFVGLGR